ncbi:MAG: aminopeptidase P family protein [Candidatus Babeliales bacterium]
MYKAIGYGTIFDNHRFAKGFLMPYIEPKDYGIYTARRKQLLDHVKDQNPTSENGVIVLFADYERGHYAFHQDATFYYYTGITEPGAVLWIDFSGETTLYIPDFKVNRALWVVSETEKQLEQGSAEFFGFDAIEYLGKPCSGFQCYQLFTQSEYEHVVDRLQQVVSDDGTIFTANPKNQAGYIQQRYTLDRIATFIPSFLGFIADISPIVAKMRRKKSKKEIELIYKAIEITAVAQEAAAHRIKPGAIEYQVQAGIEFVFTESGCSSAFPAIVASGNNGTILHYTLNNGTIGKNDLVLVDIGAQYNYYNADITRTYPASGAFTKRQQELYTIVLNLQEHIAQHAKPGVYLNNPDKPKESLNHLAQAFLKAQGLEDATPHGIGHYLGLDVHDVGSYKEPLEVGDVITIEPGIYLPKENIGIRIEDNFWIVDDGTICLSIDIVKELDDIQDLMATTFSDTHEQENKKQ